jgi:PAS domain S-box-containing protein
VLYVNPAFTRMFGYTAEEASGGSLRDLIVPETRLNENASLLKAVDDRGVCNWKRCAATRQASWWM